MTTRTYGHPPAAKARRWSATDPRYRTYRWRKLRLAVLRRDGYRCWVRGCPITGNVCDHIDAVSSTTTDAEFFDPTRLRASCRPHNIARAYAGPEFEAQFGMVARPGRVPVRQPSDVVTRDYTRRPRIW